MRGTEGELKSGPGRGCGNLKAHIQSHTSSVKAPPPAPSYTVHQQGPNTQIYEPVGAVPIQSNVAPLRSVLCGAPAQLHQHRAGRINIHRLCQFRTSCSSRFICCSPKWITETTSFLTGGPLLYKCVGPLRLLLWSCLWCGPSLTSVGSVVTAHSLSWWLVLFLFFSSPNRVLHVFCQFY